MSLKIKYFEDCKDVFINLLYHCIVYCFMYCRQRPLMSWDDVKLRNNKKIRG